MGPGQFSTQCVEFFCCGECEIELPEVPEIGNRKSFAKLLAELARQVAYQVRSVGSPIFATLFLLNNALAYLPVSLDHDEVGCRIGFTAGLLQDDPDVVEKRSLRQADRSVLNGAF